ncbi:MAG TPA: hypothetical protein VLD38_00985 [Nitrosopumilaceae archaeon]|nr:hypothetical protein [Nitrosopumilaceae archaeon]
MKEKLLLLCTCTYIEIMTAIGVTGYLIFLDKFMLAVISSAVFLPLILFHFVMDKSSKNCNKFSCDNVIG